ncbi:hypothetical protein Wxf_02450 [Wolbachia endosymbiont of Armadillidium vulgare]|nr:hypothetical protein Wxf_00839 [Wolbachia endosymbiont of Armadillidium vulgare]OJH31559.1 hypothetical protein Wxf_00953 [Wolbachia endosymbiont of Armadillidium vulgare]OJH32219.1 hypothetical protein Wxf_01644 [Wolbachia endosymbiont of Armadillidium vulgare]OJH32984.1 hypothetical protein Wxf_02450 [Wolbachia endosymbiont of Armadillidium vulgare]
MHNANVCRLLKRIEPLLAKKVTITKDRSMTPEKILKILADVTEQQIQRPEDSKNGYSGKKRTNTMKTEIIIEEGGRILSVSKSYRERFSHKETRKISTTR